MPKRKASKIRVKLTVQTQSNDISQKAVTAKKVAVESQANTRAIRLLKVTVAPHYRSTQAVQEQPPPPAAYLIFGP